MTELIRSGSYVGVAHASWSYWAIRCGLCPNGISLQPFQKTAACNFCRVVNEVVWPTPEMVFGVERLLMMRPDPSTRNWKPGETLGDLMRENAEHGIFDHLKTSELVATPGVSLMTVEDFQIRSDLLPALKPRRRAELPS